MQGDFPLQIDQLPDSRRAILEALKQYGHATIARLAGELRLTGEAVRQQLRQLRREGWVEASETERPRIGRPATAYRLTIKGDHLFPKHYDMLAISLIDALRAELQPNDALKIFGAVADDTVRRLEPTLHSLPIEKKVEALKSFYRDGDTYMVSTGDGDEFIVVERNCPFYNVAMQRPVICDISVSAMSRLLGVQVERDKSFQNGDGCCMFRVHVKRPVNASARLAGGEASVKPAQ
jgi:predicted ArsR family transcriptional regulator